MGFEKTEVYRQVLEEDSKESPPLYTVDMRKVRWCVGAIITLSGILLFPGKAS